MIQTHIRRIGLLLLLLAMQVLIFNHVHISGYATPMICVYFILTLPLSMARWAKIVWGFAIGIVQDMFANTPGMMAATLTLLAMLQPRLLTLLGGVGDMDDKDEDITPSIAKLGALPFVRYAFVGVLLQCAVFYLLENFSFLSLNNTLINIAGSTVFSLLIIWFIDSLRSNFIRR